MRSVFAEALEALAPVLDDLRVAYAVSGSFALAYWGVPRATVDVDLKVDTTRDDHRLEQARLRLRARGFRASEATKYEYRGFEVDLYPVEDRIDEESLERRVAGRLLAGSDHDFWIVTPEDLVLSKLREYARSRDYKHVDDIRKLLAATRDTVDAQYLGERVARYGFDDVWTAKVLPETD